MKITIVILNTHFGYLNPDNYFRQTWSPLQILSPYGRSHTGSVFLVLEILSKLMSDWLIWAIKRGGKQRLSIS